MNVNNPFHFRRIALLIRNDMQRVSKFSGMAAIASLPIIFALLYRPLTEYASSVPNDSFFSNPYALKFHFEYFPIFLLIGGILFTNFVFADLTPRSHRGVSLTLPAAHSEKVVAKWVLTALVFPLVALLLYQFFVLLSGWLIQRSLGLHLVKLPMFGAFTWKWIAVYISVQSIFFLGAISLGRFAAIKTILILVGVFAISSFLLSSSLSLLFLDLPLKIGFWGLNLSDMLPASFSTYDAEFWEIQALQTKSLTPVLLILIGPSLLLVSFFKFQEKEIT